MVDEAAAAYPWELLVDRRSERQQPIAVDAGMLRQLRVDDIEVVSHPEEKRILVIGDPPSRLPPLIGAQKEASGVADLFDRRDGWDVVRQIAGEQTIGPSSITDALLTNDVRILHLAGHGVYDPNNPLRTGMVIGDGPRQQSATAIPFAPAAPRVQRPLVLITPAEVRAMRLMPELVFINCCHLGLIEDAPHKLAANLATQFIRSGVKAIIAAGWPVDDEAAATFCAAFYSEMLRGAEFGNAVTRARQETYQFQPDSNTWGAYQCYGDPGYRLLMDAKVRARVKRARYEASDFLDTSELVVELGNLSSRAKVQTSKWQQNSIVSDREELRVLADRKG